MTTLREQNLTVRSPTEADIPRILALIAAANVALTGEADPYSADDIRGDWIGLDLSRDGWMIEAWDGILVGYGGVKDFGSGRIETDGYVHPAYIGLGIGSELLRRFEARAREMAAETPAETRVVLNGGTLANDIAARRLFEAHGFTPVRHFWRMRIDLTEAPPAPVWPDGIAVWECMGEQDERIFFDTLEEAFQDHWGHVPDDYDEWRERCVNAESYDPSLWFLALDGTEPAGAIRGRLMANGSGWVNTLGVRRPWRKRGLGRALLLHAFSTFYKRGVTGVALGVDAQNPTGATHVYEAAGMRVVREFVVFGKELRAGT